MNNSTLEKLYQIKKQLEEIMVLFEQKQYLQKDSDDFCVLKKILHTEEWPEAVFDFQIVDENSEEEKFDRAEGIVDILINEDLNNKKFLDFGCGEGHTVKYAAQNCSLSVGYDIDENLKTKILWKESFNNFYLTTEFSEVEKLGPYDIILVYDVLDHSKDPVRLLNQVRNLLKSDGKIYLRCHPWCSRHGAHAYRQINKAFVHLIFTADELKELNFKVQEPNIKVLYPINDYNKIIKEAGLNITDTDIERQDCEEFFQKNEIIINRLKKIFENKKNEFPNFQLEQCFLDFILNK